MLNVSCKHASILVAASALALGLAGCSSPETGTPSPVSSQTVAPAGSSTSDSGGNNPVATLQACDLLTDQEAAQFKAQAPGKPESTDASGAASTCQRNGRSVDDNSTSFTILVRPDQGLDAVNTSGGTASKGNVNGRPAVQFMSSVGAKCLVALGVTASARVDVTYVIGAGTNATEACQSASQIANIVEPKLPKYEG
ncbi:DUF3558 family protein [Amycolatopsis acidicola]|nr:DUF3558 family protein [Amycolatopsis acidicola]